MKIGLLGLSDKRHIIYSLIRVLGGIGRTIVFTPNKQYLIMSEERLPDFEINDVQIVVYDCDVEDLTNEYELNSYEYIIYDVLVEMPFKLDIVLIMDSRNEYICDLEDRKLEMIPVFSCLLIPKEDMMPTEKTIKIPPASLVEDKLQAMLNSKKLLPITSGMFIKSMALFIVSVTGLQTALVIRKLKKEVMDI